MGEQQFKSTSEHIINDLPLYKSFVLDEYYSYNKNWGNPNALQNLENKYFILKAEYLRAKQLLLTLKEKYEKHESSASFISHFH